MDRWASLPLGIALVIVGAIGIIGAQSWPMSAAGISDPAPRTTSCASPLLSTSNYASDAAGRDAVDCDTIVPRRRWIAGGFGALALVGVVLVLADRQHRQRGRSSSVDPTTATFGGRPEAEVPSRDTWRRS